VFVWHHLHDIADGGVIHGSLILVILAGVSLTSWKWHCNRWQSHPPQLVSLIPAGVHVTSWILRSTGRRGYPPQHYIPPSSSCFCDLQEITSSQTTVAHSYFKCVALLVMHTIRWDVNGFHVSTIRNLISWEGSD
jgi:hypothetical protein